MTGIINKLPLEMNKTAEPVLTFYGRKSGSTYSIPTTQMTGKTNSEYFTFISDSSDSNYGKFLCNKSFTGHVYIISTSNFNSAGSNNIITYLHYRTYINGTLDSNLSYTSNTTISSKSVADINFTAGTYTYIHGYGYNTSSSKSGSAGFFFAVTL